MRFQTNKIILTILQHYAWHGAINFLTIWVIINFSRKILPPRT
jgi:hypothetical protein